jgi:hypothetical protein
MEIDREIQMVGHFKCKIAEEFSEMENKLLSSDIILID